MTGMLRVAIACPQVELANPQANVHRILQEAVRAHREGAAILLTPKLSLTGASAGDLLHQQALLRAGWNSLDRLMNATKDLSPLIIVGLPYGQGGGIVPVHAVIQQGKLLGLCGDIAQTGSIPMGDLRFVAPGVRFGIGHTASDDGACNLWLLSEAKPVRAGSRQRTRQALEVDSARTHMTLLYANAGVGESTTDGVYTGHALVVEDGQGVAQDSTYLLTDIDLHTARPLPTFVEGIAFEAREAPLPLVRRPDPRPYLPAEGQRDAYYEELLELQAQALAQRCAHIGVERMHIAISGGLDSTMALLCCVRAADKLGMDRQNVVGLHMPGFGTGERTNKNALALMAALGVDSRVIDIRAACNQHFEDMDMDIQIHDAAFENAQARERTQVLMDMTNREKGIAVGTGDLSELALGFTTFNGDHMSMYGVNAGLPKTVLRELADYCARHLPEEAGRIVADILDTPISPELLPVEAGQQTESIVGPYELNDYILFRTLKYGEAPADILERMVQAFAGKYSREVLEHWLSIFMRRFFSQQFKRNCTPDAPDLMGLSLSPRGAFTMPSDAKGTAWEV